MDKLDVWEYIKRSNGIRNGRDVWFMSEPIGEVWLPLFVSPKISSLSLKLKSNVEVKILMNGHMYALRRPLDMLPQILKQYLNRDGDSRFSTAKGIVYDLAPYPADKGLIGRVVLNLP